VSGAEGNVTTDTEIREGDWTTLLCCLKMEERATRRECRRLEASKGWKRQQADPLSELPKKNTNSHADLLILALYIKLIFRQMTTRTGQLEIGVLQDSNCQHLLDHRKSKKVPEKHLFLLY